MTESPENWLFLEFHSGVVKANRWIVMSEWEANQTADWSVQSEFMDAVRWIAVFPMQICLRLKCFSFDSFLQWQHWPVWVSKRIYFKPFCVASTFIHLNQYLQLTKKRLHIFRKPQTYAMVHFFSVHFPLNEKKNNMNNTEYLAALNYKLYFVIS